MKVILVFLFLCIVNSIFIEAQSSDPYARDLVQIIEFFDGEFDNDSQLWFEGRRDWPGTEEEKHLRMHTTHIKVEVPSVGENVFYVEEYINDNPEEISRQRIVNFKSDKELGGIVMDLYFLKEADKFVGVKGDDELFKSLKLEDLFGLDGCKLIFKREGDQFFGAMQDKMCQFGKGEMLRYSVHDVHLSSTKYWRVDQSYLVSNDKLHKGHSTHEPFKMRKAKHYKCDISFTEKGYYDPSGNDKKYTDVILHNQGGSASFYNPIKDKTYVLQLREKEYPFYSEGSDFFMMRFIEKDATRSEVIVTAESNITKISFSLGWSSALCTLEN